MKTTIVLPSLVAGLVLAASTLPGRTGCSRPGAPAPLEGAALVARGSYLVNAMGCADCHTPWVLGPEGPAPDPGRMLSGHPEDLGMPETPALELPWGFAGSATNTAWCGPWGVSFTANLTPCPETGLGAWSEADFVSTFRTGRHWGRGREILPPMPIDAFGNLTDEDLRAIYAYLRTLQPIRNRVPQPRPPVGAL